MQSTFYAIFPALSFAVLPALSTVCNGIGLGQCTTLWWIIAPVFSLYFRLSKISVLAISAIFVLQAQWGIMQFIFQRDLGFQLVGESHLTPDTTAVAKFELGDTKIIRGYGPYPHANVLAGMLLGGLVLTMTLTPDVWRKWLSIFLILGIAITFSRAAYVGVFLVFITTITKNRVRYAHLLILLVTLIPLFLFRFSDPHDQAFVERQRGYTWAISIIREQQLVIGLGPEKYQEALRDWLQAKTIPYQPWEIAPVHSVPLLLAVEYGLLPAIGIILLAAIFQLRSRYLLFIPLVPSLLLDHYFLTNSSAFLMLWLFMMYTIWNGGGIPKTNY